MTTSQQWYNMNIVPPSQPNVEAQFTNLGNTQIEQGRLDDAIESYKQALKINPDYVEANYNMGIALTNRVFVKPVADLIEVVCNLLENTSTTLANLLKPTTLSLGIYATCALPIIGAI